MMADFMFATVEFFLTWIIPLLSYILVILYAIKVVGETNERTGAIILGFLIFAGLVLIVVVSGIENYIPNIELREYPLLVVLSLLAGILVGILFVIIVENRMKYPENLFLAVTIALSLASFFLHLYIHQMRIVLGTVSLGCLIGVFGKLYAVGPTGKISQINWKDLYKKK